MANVQDSTSLRDFPEPLGPGTGRGISDQQLLDRFLTDRDEAAFAGLVQRHSRTVWGVCRRLLQREQDAEDAFQAVFLVLARKAGSIRKREAIGSWLYGAAYRTALKARQAAARRPLTVPLSPEGEGASREPAPWSEAACRELQRALDEEVQRLPQKYRSPFVLCCLEGMSKGEAARELGWKEGTVSGRLAQARQLLQKRLVRRGITLSSVLTAIALVQNSASAAAPLALMNATVQGVLAPAAGNAAGAVLSPLALALAEDLAHDMMVARLKAVMVPLLALAALVVVLLVVWDLAERGRSAAQGAADPDTFVPPPVALGTPVDEQVATLAFSPDGRRLVTAGGKQPMPGQLQIWDVRTRKSLVTIRGIPGVLSVTFAPDGRTFATGDASGQIKVRDAATGEELSAVKGHDGGVRGVAYSPDGSSLVSAGADRLVKRWDVRGLRERQVFAGHTDQVLAVAFFRHGRAVVSGGLDRTAVIWDANTGKEQRVLRGHSSAVEAVAVSSDDKIVATSGQDQTVRLWDAETGMEAGTLEGNGDRVHALAFSPLAPAPLPGGDEGAGRLLLAGATAGGTVCLWDANSGKLVGTAQTHRSAVWTVAFSKDGTLLASGSSDRSVKLWNMTAGKNVATLVTLPAATRPVLALAYAPDGTVVALGTTDTSVQVRDAVTGDVLHLLAGHGDRVNCVAFSSDGQTLASGSSDGTVRLWDWAAGQERLALGGHTGEVCALAFSPDGQTVASAGSDQVIRLWDAVAGQQAASFPGHDADVRALTFAPDGRSLASGGLDRTIKVWQLDRPGLQILKGHTGGVHALAYSAQGALASGGDDATVKLWDPAEGREYVSLEGHQGAVWALAFTPSGRTLVSAGADKSVRVWEAATGRLRGVLNGHQKAVTSLAVHPQGYHLLSGSHDTMVLRWQGARSKPAPPSAGKQGQVPAAR